MTHRLLQELKQLQDAVVSKDEELCAASTNRDSFDSSGLFCNALLLLLIPCCLRLTSKTLKRNRSTDVFIRLK